jgi:hypothetical protein
MAPKEDPPVIPFGPSHSRRQEKNSSCFFLVDALSLAYNLYLLEMALQIQGCLQIQGWLSEGLSDTPDAEAVVQTRGFPWFPAIFPRFSRDSRTTAGKSRE